jgi:hypothetical protein
MAHSCYTNYVGGCSQVWPERPYLQNNLKQKMSGGMVQVAESLPSKHEVLSSNPSITTPPEKKSLSK